MVFIYLFTSLHSFINSLISPTSSAAADNRSFYNHIIIIVVVIMIFNIK